MANEVRGRWVLDPRHDHERGAALLEFAFCFAVLAIVVFSAVDLGRAFFTWNQVKNAAREGAAYAERDPWSSAPAGSSCANPNNIRYRTQNETGTARSDLTVVSKHNGATYSGCQTPATLSISPGDRITIEVSTPFQAISPLAGFLVGATTIRATSEVVVQ